MAYKYFVSGSPINFYSPKERFVNDFGLYLDQTFENSSSYHTIKEETFFSSGIFQNVPVRINAAVNNLTGIKVGDDFKTLLFKSDHAPLEDGTKFYFDNNYWLVVNTNSTKSLVNSCVVRRCNNTLRWTSSDGITHTEHCIIDYKIATPDNKNRTDPIIPDGTIQIICQLNATTRTIRENQRFLFGSVNSFVAYRIYGGGLNNFINSKTTDNTSAKLLEIALGKSQINEDTDDLVNGIADYYKYPVSGTGIADAIKILPVSGSIIEGETQSFSCYLMAGTTQLPNVFVFTVEDDIVPSDRYALTSVDGNNFTVKNDAKYLEDALRITCTSGSSVRIKEIYLRGGW